MTVPGGHAWRAARAVRRRACRAQRRAARTTAVTASDAAQRVDDAEAGVDPQWSRRCARPTARLGGRPPRTPVAGAAARAGALPWRGADARRDAASRRGGARRRARPATRHAPRLDADRRYLAARRAARAAGARRPCGRSRWPRRPGPARDALHLHVIDPHGSLADLGALPHLGTGSRTDDPRACAALVRHLREEVDRRLGAARAPAASVPTPRGRRSWCSSTAGSSSSRPSPRTTPTRWSARCCAVLRDGRSVGVVGRRVRGPQPAAPALGRGRRPHLPARAASTRSTRRSPGCAPPTCPATRRRDGPCGCTTDGRCSSPAPTPDDTSAVARGRSRPASPGAVAPGGGSPPAGRRPPATTRCAARASARPRGRRRRGEHRPPDTRAARRRRRPRRAVLVAARHRRPPAARRRPAAVRALQHARVVAESLCAAGRRRRRRQLGGGRHRMPWPPGSRRRRAGRPPTRLVAARRRHPDLVVLVDDADRLDDSDLCSPCCARSSASSTGTTGWSSFDDVHHRPRRPVPRDRRRGGPARLLPGC